MSIKYLVVDDHPADVTALAKNIARSVSGLDLEVVAPKPFPAMMSLIREGLQSGSIDGLIFDLRLDDVPGPNQARVDYRAPRLAQELRSSMATSSLRDVPIILWSAQAKLKKYFFADVLSQALYDDFIDKEAFKSRDRLTHHARWLYALAAGYKAIASAIRVPTTASKSLLKPSRTNKLPLQFEAELRGVVATRSATQTARFLLTKVINDPGLLFDEDVVAARLGISVANLQTPSVASWVEKVSAYKGVFHDAARRFWWTDIDRWWQRNVGVERPMLSLDAVERVELLRQATSLRMSAVPPKAGYSSRYTTVCVVTKQPLDPIDAFVLASSSLSPWQERKFVSREVALRPAKHQFSLSSLAPSEAARAKLMR